MTVSVGIIGGTGWIGAAIAKHLLQRVVPADQLWISNRSAQKLALDNADNVHYTQDNQQLIDHSDVVVISVRPQQFKQLKITFHSQLLISVMAGVAIEVIAEETNATSIVRAMPNAALDIGESFTPWYSRYLPLQHHQWTQQLLSSFGKEQAIPSESQLNYFTALTGSGQGMLTSIAASMMEAAIAQGVDAPLAEQAIRQLFSGVGQLIMHDELTPQDRAQVCLDYAGTTAAAIAALRDTGLDKVMRAGIEAAYLKAQSDMMADE